MGHSCHDPSLKGEPGTPDEEVIDMVIIRQTTAEWSEYPWPIVQPMAPTILFPTGGSRIPNLVLGLF